MDKIIWDESYSVQNQEIDAQHQEWVAIFNKLHNALLSQAYDELGSITADSLKGMHDYAEYHFKFEEEYLKRIDYPEFLAHRRLHRDFASKIYRYNSEINQGKMILNTKVIKVLKDWLVNHILVEDKKYSYFAEGKG